MNSSKNKHLNPAENTIPKLIPKQARELSAFFSLIIDETEKTFPDTFTSTGIRCFRKGCTGIISTLVDPDENELYWKCSKCRNHGTLSGW